jgi:hypothetical protein
MRRLPRLAPFLLLAASLASLTFLPRTGISVPFYSARTGLQCSSCHFDPNGGGPRNEFGFAYAKNRHSLEPDTTEAWKDLNLRNRVGDDFPLYFGLNQRFMLLANQQVNDDGLDHLGFWNMENALYTVFQPHAKLTLVYNAEATTTTNYQSRDAFALLGSSTGHYLKAGQFRVPFGLRLDDHTVATRNSFLDYQTGERFLPYDPRTVDRGVELGGTHNQWFGRASLTNGSFTTANSPPTTDRHPQAFATKVGYSAFRHQGALSFYDDWAPTGAGTSARRTRWGYYALANQGAFTFLGEIAAGTDQAWASDAVERKNLMAAFGELNWTPQRAYNLRFRYDRVEMDRSTDDPTHALNSWNRFALEGEWVPVPFAELRWVLRVIDPVAGFDAGGAELENEKQAYLQLHVSY